MMKCKACGGEVSDGAYNCSTCGESLRMKPISTGGTLAVAALIVVTFVALGSVNDRLSVSAPAPKPPPQIDAETRKALYVDHMSDKVRAALKDPDSAQFRGAFFSESGGVKVVCGEVNSKNSFGGMSGFQRFIAGGDLVFLEEQMAEGEIERTWLVLCGK